MVEWSIFNEIFAVAFNVLYFVIIIGTIFIVILDNRNPVKTMAWVLVLFFLPIVGLVFYSHFQSAPLAAGNPTTYGRFSDQGQFPGDSRPCVPPGAAAAIHKPAPGPFRCLLAAHSLLSNSYHWPYR